jgi:large subunit ribosomal protein L25
MSQTHTLNATTRKRSGSAALKKMRREGFVPAVLYGATEDNLNIKIETKRLVDLLHHTVGENLLVNLEIEGGGTKMAMIKDIQHDPLSSAILHADFHAVSADQQVNANVPLELVGSAHGVKEGGVLQHQVHSLDVQCLPKDLPETIQCDVSELAIGDALHIRDLQLPDGVTTSLDGDVVVAIITEPRVGGDLEEEGAVAPVEGEVEEEAAGGEGE